MQPAKKNRPGPRARCAEKRGFASTLAQNFLGVIASKRCTGLIFAVMVFWVGCDMGAGPAQGESRFYTVQGPCDLVFPEDHGPHPGYRSEWWYYTGNIRSASGQRFGYQVTVFRYQTGPSDEAQRWPDPASAWRTQQIFIAHAAVSDLDKRDHHQTEVAARDALAMAGAAYQKQQTIIFVGKNVITIGTKQHRLQATAPDFRIDLLLEPQKTLVLHGKQGYSRKGRSPAKASCYYSYTRMLTQGTVVISGQSMSVTGLSWMDHEFSTAPLEDDLEGWDWFSLQLDNNTELMLYFLRHTDGRYSLASSGTFVDAAGNGTTLTRADIDIEGLETWQSPASHGQYPNVWQVNISKLALHLKIEAQMANQEMRTEETTGVVYWEGSVKARGALDGQSISGEGYAELTGYAAPFKAPL